MVDIFGRYIKLFDKMFRLKWQFQIKPKPTIILLFQNTVFEKVLIIPRQGINPHMILYVLAQNYNRSAKD